MPSYALRVATMLTMSVTVVNPFRGAGGDEQPAVCECVIGARCPRCGARRGEPVPMVVWDAVTGHFCCVDFWVNPCGHVDTYAAVIAEATGQLEPQCVPALAATDLNLDNRLHTAHVLHLADQPTLERI